MTESLEALKPGPVVAPYALEPLEDIDLFVVVGFDYVYSGDVLVENPQIGIGLGREAHVIATNTWIGGGGGSRLH
ncbi:MAG: hypothetical protein ABR579_11775 [Actinomycetota bacterium]